MPGRVGPAARTVLAQCGLVALTGPEPSPCLSHFLGRSNCAENIRKHILHTGKHEGVKMYNCPKCDYGTNVPVEFRNHLKEQHPDIENPDLAYLHAGKGLKPVIRTVLKRASFIHRRGDSAICPLPSFV